MCEIRQGYGKYIAFSKSADISLEEFSRFTAVVKKVESQFAEAKKLYLDHQKIQFAIEGHRDVSRYEVIVFFLRKFEISLEPIFIPQTLYDILTTFSIDNPRIWDEEIHRSYSRFERPFHRDQLNSNDPSSSEDLYIESISQKLAFVTNQMVNRLFKSLQIEGSLNLSEIQNLGVYCFFNSPWFEKAWQPHLQKFSDQENLRVKLKYALELECIASPESVVIYRGSDKSRDSLEGKKNWLEFSKCRENDKEIPCKVHSLSFGQSFVAGAIHEQGNGGASPFLYCLKSPSCYALEIDNPKEQQMFYLPSRDLQMLSSGEFFHARTRLPALSYQDFEESKSIPKFWTRKHLYAESLNVSGFWFQDRISRKNDRLFSDLTYFELKRLWDDLKQKVVELPNAKGAF